MILTYILGTLIVLSLAPVFSKLAEMNLRMMTVYIALAAALSGGFYLLTTDTDTLLSLWLFGLLPAGGIVMWMKANGFMRTSTL